MNPIGSTTVNHALDRLGRLLQYPDENLPAAVRDAREGIASMIPAAAQELAFFQRYVQDHGLEQWRQTYTDAFDLDPLFKIYIGYHLFGESYKRSYFLLKLNEHYREHGYDGHPELPDHLGVVLRFLPHCDHEEFRDGVIREGLIPSVKKMLGKSPEGEDERQSDQEGTEVQSLQDAIRVEQSKFYQAAEIQASWHPEAFGRGVVTEGLKRMRRAGGPSLGAEPMEGNEPDPFSCTPCPFARGPAGMTAGLGIQLKGVPEREKEKEMQKEEVRKGEQERLSHPYAHVIRALERILEVMDRRFT